MAIKQISQIYATLFTIKSMFHIIRIKLEKSMVIKKISRIIRYIIYNEKYFFR